MTNPMLEPTRSRPDIPVEYGVPPTDEGMLDWSWVTDQLKKARNYWLITTYPDGRQHCIPSWGAWVENSLYFSGGDMTRHAKNLVTNREMIAHLESGDQVVIVHGTAEPATNVPAEIMSKIEADYVAKYGMGEGATYRLVPHKVLAWTNFLTTATRFLFNPKS
ncbi:MAG: pyridoxamine 5'-phosphate oxidase family protein [Chloroflexi bacterium]|nr:pyridoxamine 5'-phosphate oxidase family protein [Chloroflexota bacterium]MCC6895775.1 pyridoxamine 5'-phosphate oxidase family protein [Anaerolineae bacterium]